jgi:Ca2+-binding EF-hand superfamily protein
VHQLYGKANKDDLKKILKSAVGRKLSESEINQIFEGFDRNKDGSWDKKDFPYHYEEMPGPWTNVEDDEVRLRDKARIL